jgi:hypothetical protein
LRKSQKITIRNRRTEVEGKGTRKKEKERKVRKWKVVNKKDRRKRKKEFAIDFF